ncbi:MAG: DNA recombination protein RmuC [Metallibacterium scheffleri]|nr:DNA recombination protein RmuC [Metallibacterium scheffleri]MCK9366616.1 DNA recombination protein RmuC [Metallibacterium scheffleri]
MAMNPGLWINLLLALLALGLLLALLLSLRARRDPAGEARWNEQRETLARLEVALREELRAARQEQATTQAQMQTQLNAAASAQAGEQHRRLEAFAARLEQMNERFERSQSALRESLAEAARQARQEQGEAQRLLGAQLVEQMQVQMRQSEQRLGELRATLETRLKALQDDNASKLEQMRSTVDEKLQATLEQRLGQSFTLVSERLEAVQRGLGEMRELATGVGDLKRVLGNVKRRGIFGEVQLGALLEDMLAAEQYDSNVATVPGSNDRVEFAIRMPGQGAGEHVYLPIDAKFPVEDYQRLLDAQEAADADAAHAAGRALENRVREEAKRIHGKYVSPPHTTDFAVLYLPTEGLYAEVIRRPGLFETLQREHRVTVAGPTTLSALLNSLQMGFRTLAIAKRSSEVWKILGAVKTEFGKFSAVLETVRKRLEQASAEIDKTGVRSRAITRKLRDVELLEPGDSRALLGVDGDGQDADADADAGETGQADGGPAVI